jgi:uncharacterized phage infection (PIP) family protein YhgE
MNTTDTQELVLASSGANADEIVRQQGRVAELLEKVSTSRNHLVTSRAVARKQITENWEKIIQYAQNKMIEMLDKCDSIYNQKAINMVFQAEALETVQEQLKSISIKDRERVIIIQQEIDDIAQQTDQVCDANIHVNIGTNSLIQKMSKSEVSHNYECKHHVTFTMDSPLVFTYEVDPETGVDTDSDESSEDSEQESDISSDEDDDEENDIDKQAEEAKKLMESLLKMQAELNKKKLEQSV